MALENDPADLEAALVQVVIKASEPGAIEIESVEDEQVTSTAKAQTVSAVNNDPRSPARSATKESFVRVRTDRLDSLIDIVGELVIAQSMIAQDETVVRIRCSQ